jgi:cytochrome c oxidase subunit 3
VSWGLFTGLQASSTSLIAHYDWTFGGTSSSRTSSWPPASTALHVIIGTIFLFVCYLRVRSGHFTAEKHIGFEAAAWYWHFRRRGLAVPLLRRLHLGACDR